MNWGRNRPAAQWGAVLVGAALFLSVASGARAEGLTYGAALEKAVACLESGDTRAAVGPLQAALAQDRNDPLGLLALAALRLHTGDGNGAAQAALRARTAGDPLSALAYVQARLAARNRKVDLSEVASPVGKALSAYLALLADKPQDALDILGAVDTREPDALRLEIAGIAALRAGDTDRGAALLRAFLARPEGKGLAEAPGSALTFLPDKPLEADAPRLPENVRFLPAAAASLAGTATLTPGRLPYGVSMVSYAIPGAGFRSVTNDAPFAIAWDTTRVPNGDYTVQVAAYDRNGRTLEEREATVRVANAAARTAGRGALAPTERTDLHARLAALIAPRPSRKAAHFELALLAVRRGDSATALTAMENVCAIDPDYRQASESLRRFNRAYVTRGVAYWRGKTTEKLIALTFDDGPNPLPFRTPALLDTLRNHAVAATFFVVGARAAETPDLVQQMAKAGHEVDNHSHNHRNLTYLAPQDVWRELCRASVTIRDLTGVRPRFYRPPGGNFNGATGQAAAALGMDGAYWTVDAFKFERAPFTPAQLTDFVVKRARPGAIVLLHNAPDNTIAAVPEIVRQLRAKGYTFVTLSELVRRSQPAKPKSL